MFKPLDSNPSIQPGAHVWYRSPNSPPALALVVRVDEGADPDLIVYCQGRSDDMRERWALGHSVAVFRGRIPHVTLAPGTRPPSALWWSRFASDCPEKPPGT